MPPELAPNPDCNLQLLNAVDGALVGFLSLRACFAARMLTGVFVLVFVLVLVLVLVRVRVLVLVLVLVVCVRVRRARHGRRSATTLAPVL